MNPNGPVTAVNYKGKESGKSQMNWHKIIETFDGNDLETDWRKSEYIGEKFIETL